MKPVVIQVFGDKSKKLEPEHHRIEFPGGSICVDRTTTGEYWAHISVNTPDKPEHEETHIGSKFGKITGSRIDFDYPEHERRVTNNIETIPNIDCAGDAIHIAVKIAIA